MNKETKNSFIKQTSRSRVIFGGQVEKKGSRLIWKFDTSDEESNNVFITKFQNVVVVNGAEIHINKINIIRKKAIFINLGVEKVENDYMTCKIEFIERTRLSPANRFSFLKKTTKQTQIAKAISDLYNRESEEIEAFAKSVDKLIENTK